MRTGLSRSSKLIRYEDALQAITENLDRINGTDTGVMKGVAKIWLENVEVVEDESWKQ